MNDVQTFGLSLSEKAELRYKGLLIQFGSIHKDSITPELTKLATRTAIAYQKFSRRRSTRKFKKLFSFNALAEQLERKLAVIPLPVSSSGASCGDTSAVGSPGIIQNV